MCPQIRMYLLSWSIKWYSSLASEHAYKYLHTAQVNINTIVCNDKILSRKISTCIKVPGMQLQRGLMNKDRPGLLLRYCELILDDKASLCLFKEKLLGLANQEDCLVLGNLTPNSALYGG